MNATSERGGERASEPASQRSVWAFTALWVFPLITAALRAPRHHPFKCYYGPRIYSICLSAAFIFTVMSTRPTSAVQGAARYNNTSRAAGRHLRATEPYTSAPMSLALR